MFGYALTSKYTESRSPSNGCGMGKRKNYVLNAFGLSLKNRNLS